MRCRGEVGTRTTREKLGTLLFQSVADGCQAHEKVAAQLKKAIFEKKILPGERLPAERELAEIFNTSRVTLKNAGLINVKRRNSQWDLHLEGHW